jgi:hypothetical protein
MSLYLPKVPREAALAEIFAPIGVVDRVDWSSAGAAYVHFSTWHDCALAEQMSLVLSEEDTSYRYPCDSGGYLICRRNRRPLPAYRGPLSVDDLASAIQGGGDGVIATHIRFGESGPKVEYKVTPGYPKVRYEGPKNVHQLYADYTSWLNTTFLKSSTV